MPPSPWASWSLSVFFCCSENLTEKHPKRPRDPNQLATSIIDIATGNVEAAPESGLTKRAKAGGRKRWPGAVCRSHAGTTCRDRKSGGRGAVEEELTRFLGAFVVSRLAEFDVKRQV
jgi:hypothetical protein